MELRKDYFLDRWVILATDRAKRPRQFKQPAEQKNEKDESICFFCPGSEHLTPPEIGRIERNDSWSIRWFPNKFPAVKDNGNPDIQTHNTFFTFSSAFGYHEVIAETSSHDKQLWDMPKEHLFELLKIYGERIKDLKRKDNIRYVVIFKNHGAAAGTSLVHSHTQVVAQNNVPQIIREKISYSKEECPYCKVIEAEKDSLRRCFENQSFIAFTPYASRFNMEIWVLPKKHIKRLSDFDESELKNLSEIMKKILDKLKEINAPYNFYLQYAPDGEDLHFHIEIIPRLSNWAGYEFATGTIINAILPEDAAKFYRGED